MKAIRYYSALALMAVLAAFSSCGSDNDSGNSGSNGDYGKDVVITHENAVTVLQSYSWKMDATGQALWAEWLEGMDSYVDGCYFQFTNKSYVCMAHIKADAPANVVGRLNVGKYIVLTGYNAASEGGSLLYTPNADDPTMGKIYGFFIDEDGEEAVTVDFEYKNLTSRSVDISYEIRGGTVVTIKCTRDDVHEISVMADGDAYDAASKLYFNITSGTTVEVTNGGDYYEYTDANLTIPATITIDGSQYQVTAIGENAFRNNENIRSVTIPEGVVSVEPGAFKNCSELREVTFPSTLKTIGAEAFQNTRVLDVVLPEGLVSIGREAFRLSGSTANRVVIPSTVTNIGAYALMDKKIDKLYCRIANPTKIMQGDKIFSYSQINTLYVPEGSKSLYQNIDPWRWVPNIVEMSFGN